MEEHSENFNKEKIQKRTHSEMKTTITKMKNTLEGTNSRFENAEE